MFKRAQNILYEMRSCGARDILNYYLVIIYYLRDIKYKILKNHMGELEQYFLLFELITIRRSYFFFPKVTN